MSSRTAFKPERFDCFEFLKPYGDIPVGSKKTFLQLEKLGIDGKGICNLFETYVIKTLSIEEAEGVRRAAGEVPPIIGGEAPVQEIPFPATDASELKCLIDKDFPGLWPPLEACLASSLTLLLEDLTNPIGLILQGPPASEKTTALSFFYDLKGISMKSDNFTPKAFVSHASNLPEKKLAEVDLLPRMRNKVFIVPELAPIFGKRKEDLTESLAMLTRVFDGEGLETDSGIRGHRGYTGKYVFTWLGATTPLPNHVWHTMGKLGSRFLFDNIQSKNKSSLQLKEIMRNQRTYGQKIQGCRAAVHQLLHQRWGSINNPRRIAWDREGDAEAVREAIVSCAEVLRYLRGSIEVFRAETSDTGDEAFRYTTPIVEEPERIIQQLYNLARGRAILYGRSSLDPSDVPLLFRITLSSCPFHRSEAFKFIAGQNDYRLTIETLASLMGASYSAAYRICNELSALGVVEITQLNVEDRGVGRPIKLVRISDKLENHMIVLQALLQPSVSGGVNIEVADCHTVAES